MVTLILVKNPFSPQDGREVTHIEAEGTLADLLEAHKMENVDLRATVNGYSVDETTKIKDGDFVVIYPEIAKGGGKGGKGILGILAAVVLSVVSFGVGSLLAQGGGAFFTLGGATMGAASYIAMAAVMFLGSTLIGRFMGQKVDTGSYSGEQQDPTYSWGSVRTMEGQNNPISLTFGKVKSGGQTIGKFVQSEDNNEYLNWLVAAGEGPLTFSEIKLNDQDIGTFENVTYWTRPGTNDQSVIPNFNDTFFAAGLSYKLSLNAARQNKAQGTATNGLIVTITFPSGLYYTNDDGSTRETWVEVQLQYRLVGGNWVTWGSFRISANTTSAYRKEFRTDNLTQGEYEVKVTLTGAEGTTNRIRNDAYWTELTSIVYDDFVYPCTALIGIRALATDQLNGTPSLTFLKECSYVWVWTGSVYVQKSANNPAWASYGLLHQARQLLNINTGATVMEVRGVPAERMRYGDFAAWAEWCDRTGYQLRVNIEINVSGEMLDVVNQKIAPIGRGMVVRFGTKYGCIYDHVQDPVQMFGMGNIIAGSFSEEFLKISDRANCVEITFTNKDADYERDILTVYGDTYDSDGYAKTAQLTMDGITDYQQAYREGVYQLMCNKYQLRTVSFEADIDSIACTVGDVVLVAHDVPKWANSGRIEAVSKKMIDLPIYVEDLTKSYRLQYRTQKDNIYTIACEIIETSEEKGMTTVLLAQEYSEDDPPQAGDVFDLAIANVGSKPFVIKSITRAQNFRRRITALEYAEALYDESYEIPPIQYAVRAVAAAQNVTDLSASQRQYTDAFGVKHGIMAVSWKRPSNGGRFSVLISKDRNKWDVMVSGTGNTSAEFNVEAKTGYFVKVITVLGVTQSSGAVTGLIPAGVDEPPPAVTRINVEHLASGIRRFWWEFEYPSPDDIAGFRFKYTQANILSWERGIPVQEGLVTSQPFETQTIRQGSHAIMVKAVDNIGQESKDFAYCLMDMGDLLEENVLYKKDFSENDWEDVTHDGVLNAGAIESDGESLMWQNPDDPRWNEPEDGAWSAVFKPLTAVMQFTAPASGQFWIKSNIIGPGVIYYNKAHTETVNGQTVTEWDIEKQWSDRVLVTAGDTIKIKVVGLTDSNKRTRIESLIAYIDVPDIEEHFEDLQISADGTELPIKTPDYYTTAVRLDAVQNSNAAKVKYLSRNPCVIQLLNSEGTAVAGTADITWQGFRKEIL